MVGRAPGLCSVNCMQMLRFRSGHRSWTYFKREKPAGNDPHVATWIADRFKSRYWLKKRFKDMDCEMLTRPLLAM